MSGFLWWGYKHTSGTYHAKRYFSRIDLEEAKDSPFVANYSGPFKAESNKDALRILKNRI